MDYILVVLGQLSVLRSISSALEFNLLIGRDLIGATPLFYLHAMAICVLQEEDFILVLKKKKIYLPSLKRQDLKDLLVCAGMACVLSVINLECQMLHIIWS